MNRDDYLAHFGIKGMKWGVRRFSGQNGRLTKAGKERHNDNTDKKVEDDDKSTHKKFQLSEKQKKYIKIGMAAVVTGLAIYGGYKLHKSGKLNGLINKGKNFKVGFLPDDKLLSTNNGFKKQKTSETLKETLSKANPHKGDPVYKNNCTACSVTTFLRRLGFDVTAKSTGGQGHNLGGVIEECFKGAKILDGSAAKFGKSKADAAEMLVRRFGQNASGVVGVQWRNRGGRGHAFNWEIKDGIVLFFDGQQGNDDAYISDIYFRLIDTTGSLFLARLDNAKPNFETLKKYVQNR